MMRLVRVASCAPVGVTATEVAARETAAAGWATVAAARETVAAGWARGLSLIHI